MGLPLAVALTNLGFLRELCGANDRNLRVFEELLHAPVRSRGNELLLDTDDAEQRRRFAAMLDWLRDQAGAGRTLDRFAIASAHRAVTTTAPEQEAGPATDPVLIPGGMDRVFARSPGQVRYIDALTRHELVVAIGPAGTGKTFLAVAAALRAVLGRHKRRLVVTRPVVEAGESLGYLPGDLAQKINPYLRPLYDAMDALVASDTVRRMEETRTIEIAPLAYMRGPYAGRQLRDSRRSPERHPRADEDVPHPARRGDAGGDYRRHYPDRPAAAARIGADSRHVGAFRAARGALHVPAAGGRGAQRAGAPNRAGLRACGAAGTGGRRRRRESAVSHPHAHVHTPNGQPEVVVRATAAVSAPDTAPTGTDTAIDPSRATAQLCTALQRFGRRALQQLHRPVEVSVLLCDATTIRALNARYRGRDEVTDVLSFAMREGMAVPDTPSAAAQDDAVVGDVVIAVEVAARQAAERGEPLERELCRLLVHGMLHLLGMDHADPPDDDDRMIALQERILTELHPGAEAALVEAVQLMR